MHTLPERSGKCTAWAALLLAALAGPAMAQVDPTVTERLEQLRRQEVPALPTEDVIRTGRDDLILLRERKFFTLYGQTSGRWTDNAALTRDNRRSDWVGAYAAGLRFETRLAERFDVYADAGILGARYRRNPRLDFDGWQASAAAATTLWNTRVAFAYAPSASYTRAFGRRQVTQHVLALSASRQIALARGLVLLPALSGEYVPSSPSDFTTLGGRGGVSLFYAITNSVVAWASAEGFARDYAGFFEDMTRVHRRDHGFNLVAALRWTPNEYVNVVGSVSFTRNYSTYAPLGYRAVNLSPSLTFQIRF